MSNFEPYVCMQTNSKCYKGTTTANIAGILWHSTGANNPKISRYVQPLAGSANYAQDIAKLGKNPNNNDWNHLQVSSGVNAFIGKFADGTVGTVQTMPWNYAPWGCGKGSKGSLNKINGKMWIQFEICEDTTKDKVYAQKVYDEAIALTVYLCEKYNLDPNGTVKVNGVDVPVITCHNDAYKLGFGSGHSDINHWFPKILGKDMSSVRAEVASKLNGGSSTSDYSEEWVNGYWYEKDGSQTYEYKGEWKENDKGWWFEDSSGWYPVSKWQKIDGKWYYFKDTGYMAADEWIDGWYCGKDGAYDSTVKKTSATTSEKKVQVTTAALNVRKGATAASPIVTVVKKGEIFTITAEQNGFGKLSSGIGWIMLKYTKII